MPIAPARLCRVLLLTLAVLAGVVGSARAGEATLAWDSNIEPDLAGYVIRYGVAPGNYMWSVDVGNRTTWTVTGLQDGVRHYFVVQAYNTAGLYSPYSSEVSTVVGGIAPAPAPTISAVSPTSGTTAGGTRITVTGTGFVAGATVTVGGTAATSVTVASPTSLSATAPAHTAGTVSVTVTVPGGQSATRANAFTYVAPAPAPTISAVSPSSGTTAGGTRITVTGTGFVAGATVTVGGTAATSVAVASTTSLSATTPAHAAGAVAVVVRNPDGQSATRTSAFTYVAPAPAITVTGITPAVGPTAGGTAVTISGTGFVSGAAVSIGGTAATSVVVTNATTVLAVTPAHAAGAVAVLVTNPNGQSATRAGAFTYSTTGIDEWMARFGLTDLAGDDDGDGVTNQGEYDAQTDPTLPNTWYLAEGHTGFFHERLALVNPGTDAAEITITYMPENGAPVESQVYVPPQSRTSITVNDVPGLGDGSVATQLSARRGGVVVERSMLWSNQAGELYAGHTGRGTPRAQRQWYFAEGHVGIFETWFSVSNPNTSDAHIQIRYLLEGGQVVQRTHTAAARARLTIYANALPELADRSFSATITSDVPVTAERMMYFSALGVFWKGGTASSGVDAPATEWYIAEGDAGAFFDQYLLLQNPNASAATATLRFLRPSGAAVVVTRALPANSRVTVPVKEIAGLDGTNVSTAVTSTLPIVVERSMFWPAPFPNWYEGHAAAAVARPGTRWVLAEGEHGGPLGFESFILIANPGNQDAQVYVTVLREEGAPLGHMVTVRASSRVTISSADFGLGYREQFGAEVESLNGVPVVVDRSMYWNGGGLRWGGGTSESGVRIR